MFFFQESAENAARAFSSEGSGSVEKSEEPKEESSREDLSQEKKPTLQEVLDAKEKAGLIRKNEYGVYETIVPEESDFFEPAKRENRKPSEPDALDEDGDTIVPKESKYYKKPKDEGDLEL